MQHVTITTKGTCCKRFDCNIDDSGCLHGITFLGGCRGNLTALCSLLEGVKAQDVCNKFMSLSCGNKGTSCMQEFAKGVAQALTTKE